MLSKYKQRYYSLDNILQTGADYLLPLGEKSNGKSYAVKKYLLEKCWRTGRKIALIRRWDIESKPSDIEQYFRDPPPEVIREVTHGGADGIAAFRGKLYYTLYDEDKMKAVKVREFGYYFALSQEQKYASRAYPDVDDIVFEEFISRTIYLPNEPTKLMTLISTIARRRKVQVFMIGNTISRVCPYFQEWQLVNIPRQKQGTIDIYNYTTSQFNDDGSPVVVKIAVEYCENSGANSKMFFGTSSNMITSGEWQSKEMPHLAKRVSDYSEMYMLIMTCKNFKFMCQFLLDKETGMPIWYITPKTTEIKAGTRVVTDNPFHLDTMTTIGFVPLSDSERLAFKYMDMGNIAFSDNLTGTDFMSCYSMVKKARQELTAI